MMPLSLKQISMSPREKLKAADHDRFESCDITELKQAAQFATRLSMAQDVKARSAWADIARSCRIAHIPLASCIFDEVIFGKSLAERVIEAGDWRSCAIFASSLEDGTYANGRIVKTGEYFMTTPDDEGRSVGLKSYNIGGYYGGEFKNGMRHGLGVWDSAHMRTYAGEWFDDKMDGKGTSEIKYPYHKKEVGMFSAGVLVAPEKPANLWQALRKLTH